MRFTRWFLSASLLVTAALLGCAGETTEEVKEEMMKKETTGEPIIDIETPIGDVQVDTDGVDVQAGGVDVSTDSAAGEVSVEVEPTEQPAE